MNNEIVEKTVKVRVYSAALASNMASLSNGRSIGGLRADMGAAGYKIGQGTLERIYKGDKGVRMESLEKVADYFGTEVDQLMRDTKVVRDTEAARQLQHRLIDADPETKKMVELALMSDMDLEQSGLTPSLKNFIGFVKNQIREELRDAAAGEK